ncbi:MAG TPA: class I SAM-dependent methyltransferase [Candidatus Deferrimicrobium sp.]|nr:class I SAM-dependent methyltransferase [Candidatus Deferrimicrobium sp.]
MDAATPLMYGRLAGWFHLLTAPDEYAEEAAEVLRLLESHVEGPLATALELGSGGGNLASHLVARLRLTLTDASPQMLELSRSINPDAEHIEADMRTLRLGRTFDAVISHDAIGYMTTEADLRAAFETAFMHLRPGGAAIFMPDWVLDTYQPRTEHGGRDEGTRALRYLEWDRALEPGSHVVRTDYVIVTRDGDDVEVHHDVHRLGIFPRATWLALLTGVGFEASRLAGEQGLDVFMGMRRRR